MRQEYTRQSLDISDVSPDPHQQFNQWFEEAKNAYLPKPNAMHMATASVDW